MLSSSIVIGLLSAVAPDRITNDDVVIFWSNVALESVRETSTNPPMATRVYAMVHTAMFDAVNGVHRRYAPYLVRTPAKPGASADVAVACAAYLVLSDLYPDRIATYERALHRSLDPIPDDSAKFYGREYGRFVGNAVIENRSRDGAFDDVDYQPSREIGRWAPTPPGFLEALLPNWPFVMPWAMTHASQFRPEAPPALESAEYALAFEEVKRFGEIDSTARTREQTEIALFWADGAGTVTPAGHWLQIAHVFADMFDDNLLESARLLALLTMAQADAAISAWDSKYQFDHWRPVTGIWFAELDHNAATAADPSWLPLIVTPPFPSYVSGHSTFSGASSLVLARFYGSDDIAFSA